MDIKSHIARLLATSNQSISPVDLNAHNGTFSNPGHLPSKFYTEDLSTVIHDLENIKSFPAESAPEVDLRQALRRCFQNNVPIERIIEIFRLEAIEVTQEE
jgi:hypothetical protein